MFDLLLIIKVMNKQTLEPQLLIDSHCGIYTMNEFSHRFNLPENFVNYDEVKEDLGYLGIEANIDNENYNYAWINVIDNAKMIDTNGVNGYLYQNEDLYFVPDGYENEDFFNN
jgi:hypothetical protein